MQDFGRQFSTDGELTVAQIATTAMGNMAYPGETVRLTVQFQNSTKEAKVVHGRWVLVDQTLRTVDDDVFNVELVVHGTEASDVVEYTVPAGV